MADLMRQALARALRQDEDDRVSVESEARSSIWVTDSMAITGTLAADFSQFKIAAEAAEAKLNALEGGRAIKSGVPHPHDRHAAASRNCRRTSVPWRPRLAGREGR